MKIQKTLNEYYAKHISITVEISDLLNKKNRPKAVKYIEICNYKN